MFPVNVPVLEELISTKIYLREVFRWERKTPPNIVDIEGILSLFFRCFLGSNASAWEAGVLPLNYIHNLNIEIDKIILEWV